MLVLGSLIGPAVYHFAIARADVWGSRVSGDEDREHHLGTFEKIAANVDATRGLYQEVPPPDDAEEFLPFGPRLHACRGFPNAPRRAGGSPKRLPDPSRPTQRSRDRYRDRARDNQ